MSSKRVSKLSIKEIVLYCICLAFVLWGLVYVVLGLLAAYLPISHNANPLYGADNAIRSAFGLGFLGWGLILAGVFAALFAILLTVFARGSDRNSDKDQKRAARMARNKNPEEKVIDAPVEEKAE